MAKPLPPSPDPRIEAFMRQVDARLARGNARLQLGLVVTPEEVAARREEVLRIRF